MVTDRITDGKRIGQLLASELTGLETPPLDRVSVVDADTGAEPSANGTRAYRIADGEETIADVILFSDQVSVSLQGDRTWPTAVEFGEPETALEVESGAAVKGAVDAIRVLLTEGDSGGPNGEYGWEHS